MKNSEAIDNFDEGFDFDEEGDGDIIATFISVTATGNKDEGIKCSEEDDGNVDIELTACTVINNLENDGMEFEAAGQGRIDVSVVNTVASNNGGPEDDADLKVEQEFDTDEGTLKIVSSSDIDSIEYENVVLEVTGSD